MGIFNSQIFNNAIFNTSQQVVIEPVIPVGISGRQRNVRNTTFRPQESLFQKSRKSLSISFKTIFLVRQSDTIPVKINIYSKQQKLLKFIIKSRISKKLDIILHQKS